MNVIEHVSMTEEFDYDFAVRYNKTDKKLYIYRRKIQPNELMQEAPALVPVFIQWLIDESKQLPRVLGELAELSKGLSRYVSMLDNPMVIMMIQQMLQRGTDAPKTDKDGTN